MHFFRSLQTETALTILFQNAQRGETKKVLSGPARESAAAFATAYSQADFDD